MLRVWHCHIYVFSWWNLAYEVFKISLLLDKCDWSIAACMPLVEHKFLWRSTIYNCTCKVGGREIMRGVAIDCSHYCRWLNNRSVSTLAQKTCMWEGKMYQMYVMSIFHWVERPHPDWREFHNNTSLLIATKAGYLNVIAWFSGISLSNKMIPLCKQCSIVSWENVSV